jgi:hypothetical protein
MILHSHSVVMFDQGLNPEMGMSWSLDAETFGVSGGQYAGLKP